MSIQVSLDGFSFCTLDTEQRQVVFFHEQRFEKQLNPTEVLERIENFYLEEESLTITPLEVELLFSNHLYTIVPTQFYQEENASDFLKFNVKILQTDVISKDYIADKMVNIYIPYTNILNYFFDKYGEFQYRHSVSVLVEELLKDANTRSGTTFYANIYESGFDLVVISDGRLHLTNSFQCQTKEDFLYYLLFTAEQLEQDPEEFKLVFLGAITKESVYYQTAHTYIRHIEFLDISLGYSYAGKGRLPTAYQHFSLLKSLS